MIQHGEKIIKLNELMNQISIKNDRISEINNLINYEFKEGNYGDRKNCFTQFTFEVEKYNSISYTINMSNNIAAKIRDLLSQFVIEETEVIKELENEYLSLLSEIEVNKKS